MSSILRKYSEAFGRGSELDAAEAELFLDAMISETDESQLADVFIAWNKKGIEENEIYSIARIMRERMTRVNSRHETFVDIVGTGGSKAKTFNVSTAAAFVVAGAGVSVAKHGNKAATSNSGSADVLSELGIDPAVDPGTAERCLNEIGICFMFAPNYHRLSSTLGKVRRGLGFPTIFNCVGPLCNPASAPHQLIGVWDKELVPKMASAVARLGTKKSWIVHGEDGLDEISASRLTYVAEVNGMNIDFFEISPYTFGTSDKAIEGFRVERPDESAALIRSVFQTNQNTAARDLIGLNSAAALYIAARAGDLEEAFGMAIENIQKGQAHSKLEELASAIPR